MLRIARVAGFSLATLVLGGVGQVASAQTAQTAPAASAQGAQAPAAAGQGVAVLAIGGAREEAFDLARALYGTRLRPANLDEVRARVLAGAPPPANASRELRDLAELRAGVAGDDAAGRRLLTGLGQQVGAEALIVVKVERGAPVGAAAPPSTADAGAAAPTEAPAPADGDVAGGNAAPATTVVARLFLIATGEFDAARYQPDPEVTGAAAWRSTVVSLEARFPQLLRSVVPSAAMAPVPVKLQPEGEKAAPFYASPWFWAALGGAALLGGAFYFATQDTSSDPIHLQMRVPR